MEKQPQPAPKAPPRPQQPSQRSQPASPAAKPNLTPLPKPEPDPKPANPSNGTDPRPALVRFGDIRGLRMFGVHSDHCYINDVAECASGIRFPVSYTGIRAGSLPGTTETVECRGQLMVHWENVKAIFYPDGALDDIDIPIPRIGF